MSSPVKNHRTNGQKKKKRIPVEPSAQLETQAKESAALDKRLQELEESLRLLETKNAELQEELITERTRSFSSSASGESSPSDGSHFERGKARAEAPLAGLRRSRSAPEVLALRDIRLRQSSGFVDDPERLSPRQPFFVHVRLRLPSAPSKGRLEADGGSYEVRVVVKDVLGEKAVAAESAADDLTLDALDYESVVKMPGLEPGTYFMSVYGIVPSARIGEQKSRPVVVGQQVRS